MPKPPDDRRQEFTMNLEGVIQIVIGKFVGQVGKDPTQEMVYVFVKGEAGGNYLRRIGTCSCCNEVEEDWIMFNFWKELEERIEEQSEKLWLLKIIAGRMCEQQETTH